MRARSRGFSPQRALRGASTSLLLLLLTSWVGLLRPETVLAARSVRATEVSVPSSGAAAFADGMRLALVRLTGRRDADQNPAFAELIADARRYAQVVRAAAAGGTQITFDAAALERAVLAAGGALWSRERPVALVVIAQPPSGADANAVRAALDEAANQRGLPLQFASAATAGLAGADITPDSALAAARRLGADVALIGRADDPSRWSWTLYGRADPQSFSGAVSSGVHGAADLLARATDAVLVQPEQETRIRVENLRSLRDYATVTRMIAGTPGVRGVALIELAGDAATWRVFARGGGDGLSGALAAQAQLQSNGVDASGTPTYRWRP